MTHLGAKGAASLVCLALASSHDCVAYAQPCGAERTYYTAYLLRKLCGIAGRCREDKAGQCGMCWMFVTQKWGQHHTSWP